VGIKASDALQCLKVEFIKGGLDIPVDLINLRQVDTVLQMESGQQV
jgi:hypothetical protein